MARIVTYSKSGISNYSTKPVLIPLARFPVYGHGIEYATHTDRGQLSLLQTYFITLVSGLRMNVLTGNLTLRSYATNYNASS